MTIPLRTFTKSVNYEGNKHYTPIKNSGVWTDQCGQQIRKNYKRGIKCPCRQYCNENCGTNYKTRLIYESNDLSYFIQTHIKSGPHKKWLEHKNILTTSLENKSTNELVERIEELERNIRKDKVDFRKYLELKDKEYQEIIKVKDEALKLKDELIQALNKKSYVPIGNLLD